MNPATTTWPTHETAPERIAILTAADRLLAGTPQHSRGRLSVVQLAAEAQVKYWIVAQKHTDLRDHFQMLAAEAKRQPKGVSQSTESSAQAPDELDRLRTHCADLEELVTTYGLLINELSIENEALRAQLTTRADPAVTPINRRRTPTGQMPR
ncbi:hypothetical protein [Kitasatospora griseola]|uniref:hypothetical protein n=1 Tax=Kitasatospora griseola TaxID=2064 RepID=UPI001670030D|nr:hypothetical protein [Kitasatospora griseola]GGR05860.1 hypothetical protein GCM10010195_71330 [Kitasatospora griseola]